MSKIISIIISIFTKLSTWLVLAIALGIILRIINLDGREFWYDEVLSLLLSNGKKIAYIHPQNIPVILSTYNQLLQIPQESNLRDISQTIINLFRGIVGTEPHPPLFYLSHHFWLLVFGNSVAATRSLNAFLSIISIGIIYYWGKILLGNRTGLLLAALLATNPFYLFHSLNFRMYGFVVFWTILSGTAIIKLIDINQQNLNHKKYSASRILLAIILTLAMAGGLLTFYLFAYWFIVLAILVIYLDKNRWWLYGLCFIFAGILTLPWVIWGTRQQLRNADLHRFAEGETISKILIFGRHLQDVVQTLGNHLILGDWITILPGISAVIAGGVIIGLFIFASVRLWHQGDRQILIIAVILGIFPLILALFTDIISGNFTLAFGWGRSMIFILPGCLFFVAVCLEKITGKWRNVMIISWLLFYLTIDIADFSIRQRSMFHTLANSLQQYPEKTTLIVLNSKAWGHVLRLAYYIPPNLPVMLLAEESKNLANSLEQVLNNDNLNYYLNNNNSQYSRIIWLESGYPLWSAATTEAERNNIENLLNQKFTLINTKHLSGTMNLDDFMVKDYIISEK